MHSTKPQSRRIAQQPYHQPLKLLLDQMVSESWTPLTGQWTKLSTRDGNCGHIRLDSPLMPWRETQRIPKSLIFTIGSMEKGSQRLKDGKTTKSSSASQIMMLYQTRQASTLQKKIESYLKLFELSLTPRSNLLLAAEDLYLTKQGSMTSGEFHSHILKIVKRCQFPCQKAEERAIRDAIFMGMNSQRARDKAINLMNEKGKEVTVEFLMNHLAVEDGNTQHKFLSQINSNSSMNFAPYDRRQNRGKSNRSKRRSGKNEAQNKTRVQISSSTAQPSRKPPGMEGKCTRCRKPEHQPGQKCTAKNAKCKECHKIFTRYVNLKRQLEEPT